MSQEHQTKQAIRQSAKRLFAAQGYHAVSMRDIAQAIGKQPGGLYNHFASKQAILVDLMVENLKRAHDFVIAPLDATATPETQLDRFVRQHVAYHIQNPEDIFIAYMELRSLDSDGAKLVLKERDAYENALRMILHKGAQNGQFTLADPAIHARSILAMLGGVTVWYRESGKQSLQEITESYVQAALQSVGSTYHAQA